MVMMLLLLFLLLLFLLLFLLLLLVFGGLLIIGNPQGKWRQPIRNSWRLKTETWLPVEFFQRPQKNWQVSDRSFTQTCENKSCQ